MSGFSISLDIPSPGKVEHTGQVMKRGAPADRLPPWPSTEIASATKACLNNFEKCLSVAALRRDEWAENRLAEFHFWINSVGALATSKASLDARLQVANETQVHFTVLKLLNLLNTLLGRCISTGMIQY